MLRRDGFLAVLCGLVTLIVMSACSSRGPGEPAAISSEPAVPGGAAVIVPAGSPPICTQLASSPALRNIATLLIDLATADDSAAAAQRVSAAAQDLHKLRGAAPETIQPKIGAVADALQAVAQSGLTEPTGAALSSSLADLGTEAQVLCHFPVGES